MVIAIGGVSRAGKSTLAKLLKVECEKLGKKVSIVERDKYVFAEKRIPKIRDKTDWESPASIDFKKFHKAIQKAKKEYDYVITEGLLVYHNPSVNITYDKNIFIEIPKTLFVERKNIDLRWGSTPEPKWYIDHIWKSYQRFGKVNLPAEFLRLSGKQKFDLAKVLDYLEVSTEEAALFNSLADKLELKHKHVARGPMMSAPGIRYKNKNFAFFHDNEMTFKLGKNFNAKANGIKIIRHLDPFKTKPPLTAWYIIAADQKEIWEDLATLALDYIKQEVG